jgi:hypothetical protein
MRHFCEAGTLSRNYQEIVDQTTVCFVQIQPRSRATPAGSVDVRLRSSMASGVRDRSAVAHPL